MPRHDETMTTDDAASDPAGYDAGSSTWPCRCRSRRAEEHRRPHLPEFTVTLDRTASSRVVTGVNIDGATLQDLPRTGTWHLDERIPASEQTGRRSTPTTISTAGIS